jgi:hypothetical protein
LNTDDNIDLTRPFTIEEIKNALFWMDVNMAPGPDNIPIEFFQHWWHIVQSDVVYMFSYFFHWAPYVKIFNYGVITLLPKISGAEKI